MAIPHTTTIFSFISSFYYIFTGILGIGLLIGFHELGHFFFAKVFGVDVPSFSLGMGPSLLQKKIGGTLFKLSAIPLGGYVEMAGAAEVGQGEQKDAFRRDEGSFAIKPYYQKLLILLGGIVFNLFFAYVSFILLFALGMPKVDLPLDHVNTTTKIKEVIEGGAAQKAGIQAGDTIISVNNQPLHNDHTLLLQTIRSSPNQELTLEIQRGNQHLTVPVKVQPGGEGQPIIGKIDALFAYKEVPAQSFMQAIRSGITATNTLTLRTIQALAKIFKKRSAEGLGGPVSIISQITKSAQQGFKVWLLILILISINLAVLNLIPLPILDGGQILFYSIEALIGRPLPDTIRLGIHYASWILVMFLFVYLSYKDLRALFFK